jgi:hypothetical protein
MLVSLRIRDPVPFWPLDPRWVKNKIRIRDEQPGSYFRELGNQFFGFKYLNYLMRIRDPGWKKFRSGMENIRIRNNVCKWVTREHTQKTQLLHHKLGNLSLWHRQRHVMTKIYDSLSENQILINFRHLACSEFQHRLTIVYKVIDSRYVSKSPHRRKFYVFYLLRAFREKKNMSYYTMPFRI